MGFPKPCFLHFFALHKTNKKQEQHTVCSLLSLAFPTHQDCSVMCVAMVGCCCMVLCWESGGRPLGCFQILFSFRNRVALNVLGYVFRSASASYQVCKDLASIDTANCFHMWMCPFILPPTVDEKSHSSTFFPIVRDVCLQCFTFSFYPFLSPLLYLASTVQLHQRAQLDYCCHNKPLFLSLRNGFVQTANQFRFWFQHWLSPIMYQTKSPNKNYKW